MINRNFLKFLFYVLIGIFFVLPISKIQAAQQYVAVSDSGTTYGLGLSDYLPSQTIWIKIVFDGVDTYSASSTLPVGGGFNSTDGNGDMSWDLNLESLIWTTNTNGTYIVKFYPTHTDYTNDTNVISFGVFYRTAANNSWTTQGHWTTDPVPVIHVSSDVVTNTTWTTPNIYMLSGNVSVDPGVTLTVTPGTYVTFSTSTPSSLTIDGTLQSIGEPTDATQIGEIFFISSENTRIGTPAAGDWGGLIVNPGGVADLAYTTLRYGGSSASSNALVYNNGGILNIASSTIAYSSTYGVKNSSGTTTITSSDIAFSDYGVYLGGGSVSVTASSTIHDNSIYGIYNTTTGVINAQNNWWATSTGPYHTTNNPSGGGNTVSDYVDFNNWKTIFHYYLGNDSVNNYREIRWDGTTTYWNEWYNAIAAWNTLGKVNIATTTGTTTLNLTSGSFPDVVWVGAWNPSFVPHSLIINDYYASGLPMHRIQNVIMHELGHALGLHHSYTGNIMYFQESGLTTLGFQDKYDYHSLWP